jgi:hypothetical protein
MKRPHFVPINRDYARGRKEDIMAKAKKKASVSKTRKAAHHPAVHHRVSRHMERPVSGLLAYTIILMFLVATLIMLATYL